MKQALSTLLLSAEKDLVSRGDTVTPPPFSKSSLWGMQQWISPEAVTRAWVLRGSECALRRRPEAHQL